MTDNPNYNDGNWHEWNGGECPVHQRSVIEGYWRCDDNTSAGSAVYNRGHAYGLNFAWDGGTKLQLFRVIKEHREPRAIWVFGAHNFETQEKATAFRDQLERENPGRGFASWPISEFREVTK